MKDKRMILIGNPKKELAKVKNALELRIIKEDNYMYPVTKRNSKHMKNYENNKSTLYSERSSMQTVLTFATICSKKKF